MLVRMINIVDKKMCSGCHACFNICPKQCIKMKMDDEGFLYPRVENGCIECGMCIKVCPFLEAEHRIMRNEAWAAYSADAVIRDNSSSGGLFTLIEELILEQKGLIFGAAFSEDWKIVKHKSSSSGQCFRSSKYVQSIIGNTYKEIKDLLQRNVVILFSGTPCQVTGLKNYLGKEYENLVCVDIICHGVPSPLLWKRYIEYLEKERGGIVEKVNFRYKKKGWKNYGFYVKQNGKEYITSRYKDPYMQMFLMNYSLRPSCYACKIKECGSKADITLGDFWGIGKLFPEMDDDKGTSLVIVHTEKGKDYLNRIQKCVIKEVDYHFVQENNSALCKSVVKPNKRNVFFLDMYTMDFKQFLKRYGTPNLKQRITSTYLYQRIRPFIRKCW